MGALMREFDWLSTSLGAPTAWPRSLKTAIRIMLTSRQPIWIGWGPELIFFYNDPYKTIIGGKHPWALGRPTHEVWNEIWDDIAPLLATAQAGVEGTYVEERLLIMERNGYEEETYYTFSYSPIPDDGGNTGGIICANSDDTARVIGERQLRLLRELAASAVDARTVDEACAATSVALSTATADVPFALLYLQDSVQGFRLAAYCGIDPGHAIAPPLIADLSHSVWAHDSSGNASRDILVRSVAEYAGSDLPTGAWQRSPHQVAIVPVVTAGGSDQDGFLVVGLNPWRLLDQSYERFLLLAAGQIAGTIAYARAYEQQQLRADELADLDRAKTAFFSNISHEFRTPLTLMLGPLEELSANAHFRSEDRALVDITYRNSRRLLKLVNALLDFSRIEAGRVDVRLAPVDVSSFTADLASLFRSLLEKAGLVLNIDCPSLRYPVAIDRDLWERIVLNLMSNAFKFTLTGSISVKVSEVQDSAVIEISDTGIGIAPDELQHIFKRFHRVQGAHGRSIEGSGIGLALVYEFVAIQGGKIDVHSEAEVGSCFRITLPLLTSGVSTPEDPRDDAYPASVTAHEYVDAASRWLLEDPPTEDQIAKYGAADIASTQASEFNNAVVGKILIVDDNADLRDYISRILNTAGHEIATAADGYEALALIKSFTPDVIVSDVMMPRLDGFGLVKALREDPLVSKTPIILLSARAGEEATLEGLQAGADDYLAKPFSAREMLARVASNLQLARLRSATEASLREETRTLELINQVGSAVSAELDLARAVQVVTDAATELTGAAFGAFFYNVVDQRGETYMLYSLSGVEKDTFANFAMPRNTAIFSPTFSGRSIVRSDDITEDPRYGKMSPHFGMPKGHLAVRSYLAAPVVSRTGEVLGGLFFGHPEPSQFDLRAERLLVGVAAQAASAIDNARLYSNVQAELTQRVSAEASLRTLNETLEERVLANVAEKERLWETSEDLLVTMTPEGGLIRLSPSWFRTLGYELHTLSDAQFLDLLHPEDLDRTSACLAELASTKHAARLEAQFQTNTGNSRMIAWTLSADPRAKLIHGVGRDVTKDIERDEALRQAEKAVIAAQKMEAIGQLTGGVAHDFNNLLQVIGGNLHLLSKDVIGQERPEQRVRQALAGVARGAKLASQLLAFGRRQPLAPKVVNLGRFVRDMDDMLRRALGEGIEIETVVSGGLWNTLADPFQVENALLNLAINARDAMKGHGRLTIEAGNAALDDAYVQTNPDAARGQYVMLAVSDSGTGIPTEILEHVFEPFFTTKPEGKGTGLGLSMVYGFIKQSGGHVKIYSEVGHGTTVRMYLPRARAEEDLLIQTEAGPIVGGSETVLVAEDDEGVRVTVVDMLTDLGYKVLKAKDAQDALVIIESGVAIDLLFTDVVMPGALRSPELARKARERLPGIAVLFTSGYTENAIVHEGRLDQGVELLSKPYTRDAMARKIRYVLRTQQQRNAASQTLNPAFAKPPAASTALKGICIVLVEDDGLVREATAEILRAIEATVIEAPDGATAVQSVSESAPDVMVIDIGLPDISGIDVAMNIVAKHPGLPIIFASGHDVQLNAQQRSALFQAVSLRKPYSPEDLIRALQGAIHQRVSGFGSGSTV